MTDTDTRHDRFPYEDDDGTTVYRGRIRTSGTAGVTRPLHVGDQVAVITVGQIIGYGIGPFENLTTRTHTLKADQVVLVPVDDVDELVTKAAAAQAALDQQLEAVAEEIPGQQTLEGDQPRLGLAKPQLDAAEQAIRDRHGVGPAEPVEGDDVDDVDWSEQWGDEHEGEEIDGTREPVEGDTLDQGDVVDAVVHDEWCNGAHVDDVPCNNARAAGDALADVEALEEAAPPRPLPDLSEAQLAGLAAAAAGRVHPSTRTDVDAGTINGRTLTALDAYGLVDGVNGEITPEGREVLERYRRLGAGAAQ